MCINQNLEIVSTDEVIEFATLLKDVPSDVALELLAQYPEFVKMMTETLQLHQEVIKKAIDANQQNVDQCFLFYQEILRDISKCLENESLSYEERMKLIDKEIEIAKIIGQKETEVREMNRLLTR